MIKNVFAKHVKMIQALFGRKFSSSMKPSEVLRYQANLGSLKLDASQENAAHYLDIALAEIQSYNPSSNWMNRFSQEKAPKGLYLYGSAGSGKTMLMDIFYDCCKRNKKRKVHFNEFMIDIHARIHKVERSLINHGNKKQKKPVWDPISIVATELFNEAWLLCFDEFQVTDIADAMILKSLFSSLFKLGLIMVATSNRHPDELYNNGLHRSQFMPFIALLKNKVRIINIDSGIDYRALHSSSESSYYFLSGDKFVDTKIDKIVENLTSKEVGVVRSMTIQVNGRTVLLKKTCGGVLDSTFQELCSQSLGSSDYIQFAKKFHTIVIRNVPVLNLLRNETRRFITLIDILYKEKVRIVISAEELPEKLFSRKKTLKREDNTSLLDDLNITRESKEATSSIFTGSEEISTVDRTISRLYEMQTSSYWNKYELK